METLKENYRRAAFADYESTGRTEIKNNFSTISRLLAGFYTQQSHSSENAKIKNLMGLISSSLAIETIFYLPNHFR